MNAEVIRAAINISPAQMDMDRITACIAGNCAEQNGVGASRAGIYDAATALMELDEAQADRLFALHLWPEDFAMNIMHPDGYDAGMMTVRSAEGLPLRPRTKPYLARVTERVEHFISTGGAA